MDFERNALGNFSVTHESEQPCYNVAHSAILTLSENLINAFLISLLDFLIVSTGECLA